MSHFTENGVVRAGSVEAEELCKTFLGVADWLKDGSFMASMHEAATYRQPFPLGNESAEAASFTAVKDEYSGYPIINFTIESMVRDPLPYGFFIPRAILAACFLDDQATRQDSDVSFSREGGVADIPGGAVCEMVRYGLSTIDLMPARSLTYLYYDRHGRQLGEWDPEYEDDVADFWYPPNNALPPDVSLADRETLFELEDEIEPCFSRNDIKAIKKALRAIGYPLTGGN